MNILLDELAEQLGPPDEGMVTEAVAELTALVYRARTACGVRRGEA